MKRIDLKKVLRMDFMIQHRCTGTPEEFARKLDLSRSTFFEYLAYFRYELGTDILYDKYQRTYHYTGGTLYPALRLKWNNIQTTGAQLHSLLLDIRQETGRTRVAVRLARRIRSKGNEES